MSRKLPSKPVKPSRPAASSRASAGKASARTERGAAPPPSRTNAQWTADTTRRLLACAREEFTRLGFDGASVDRIAERAKLTKGAVYYHFESKRGLFREIFEQLEIELVERINSRAMSVEDPFEGLILGCAAFVDEVIAPEFSRVILIDAPRVLGIAEWRRIDARYGMKSLREGIDACIEAGRLRPVDAESLTILLSGAMNEAVLTFSETGMDEDSRVAIHATIRSLIEGLCQR